MPNHCTTKGSPCRCILYVCECVYMGLYVTVHTCECLHVLIWKRNSPGPGKEVTEIAYSGAHEHWHFLYAWEILVHGLNQIHRERFWISNTHQIIKWGIVESSLPIIVEGKAQNNGIMDDLMAVLVSSTWYQEGCICQFLWIWVFVLN